MLGAHESKRSVTKPSPLFENLRVSLMSVSNQVIVIVLTIFLMRKFPLSKEYVDIHVYIVHDYHVLLR